MRLKLTYIIFSFIGAVALSGCAGKAQTDMDNAYWQRVDAESALYMTGPKAQQELEENVVSCVGDVKELVMLDAIRKTLPPDTHGDYHRALEASGDLDYYETPRRLGDKKVAHKDFHDFESCMRGKGWERVKYVRYDADRRAMKTYRRTKNYRKTGRDEDDYNPKKSSFAFKSSSDFTYNQ